MNINIVVIGDKEVGDVTKIKWPDNRSCVVNIVRVGDRDRPAAKEDLQDIASVLELALKESALAGDIPCIVGHHAISIEKYYLTPELRD